MALKARGAFAIVGVGAKRLVLVIALNVVVHGHVAYGVAETWLLVPDEKTRRGKSHDRCDASNRDGPPPANPTPLLPRVRGRLGQGVLLRRRRSGEAPLFLFSHISSPLLFASLKFIFCYFGELYAAHYIMLASGRK